MPKIVPVPEANFRTPPKIRRSDLLRLLQRMAVSMLEGAAAGEVSRHPSAPIERLEAAGGLAVFMGAESPLSRAIGLGSRGRVTESEIEAVEHFFASRGAPVRIAMTERTHSTLVSLLTQRGYQRSLPMQNWYLWLPNRPPGLERDVEVTPASADQAETWANVVATGFQESNEPQQEIGPEMASLFKTLGFAADSRPYFALREGEIAGGAVLSVCGEVGFLRTASSRWAHRSHGVQSALIAARLRDAERLGCNVVFSSTQGSRISERNLIRNGFRRLSQSYVMEKQTA